MIPETHSRREVRLYRASAFPYSWRFERTLLSGAAFTDASIVRHEGRETAPGQWIACVDGFRKAWMLGYRRWPSVLGAR
jgi:hypothetical protein